MAHMAPSTAAALECADSCAWSCVEASLAMLLPTLTRKGLTNFVGKSYLHRLGVCI